MVYDKLFTKLENSGFSIQGDSQGQWSSIAFAHYIGAVGLSGLIMVHNPSNTFHIARMNDIGPYGSEGLLARSHGFKLLAEIFAEVENEQVR